MLLTTREKEEDVLVINDGAALINLLEETKQAMEMLSEAMKSNCYIYDADCHDLEKAS